MSSLPFSTRLKGHGNEADFLGFCRNWVLIDPLHYLLSRSAFGFEFAEIFVIEKRLPDLANRGVGESGSRWLSDSASRGVDDSPTRRVGESAFVSLKEKSESRRLPDSVSRGVANSGTNYEYSIIRKWILRFRTKDISVNYFFSHMFSPWPHGNCH